MTNETQAPQPVPPNGGPAFPNGTGDTEAERSGMSLRDYFAAKALQGMFASDTEEWNEQGDWLSRAVAVYAMADAMLKARGGAA